jgi:hypothetical protein
LDPISIREKKAREVFLLIKRINKYNKANRKDSGRASDGNNVKVIRRQAGDDWF